MFRHTPLRVAALALLAAAGIGYAFGASYFGLEILTEIAILAILVLALDMVAGFGGMVSLCHGAILGVSAYTYGILTAKLGYPALPSAVAAISAAASGRRAQSATACPPWARLMARWRSSPACGHGRSRPRRRSHRTQASEHPA